jgi:hypothetical protein
MVEHCSLLQITSASTAFSPSDTAGIASGGMFKVFCPRNSKLTNPDKVGLWKAIRGYGYQFFPNHEHFGSHR